MSGSERERSVLLRYLLRVQALLSEGEIEEGIGTRTKTASFLLLFFSRQIGRAHV